MMSDKLKKELATTALFQAEKTRGKYSQSISAPVDPVDMAIKAGCEVIYAGLTSLEGMYSPKPKPTILIGSMRPSGRRNFTCAHELGHHIFKHGTKLEAIIQKTNPVDVLPDEFLVDSFAGFLLMPKSLVMSALKMRRYSASDLTPIQAYRLSSYLGVGYTTFLYHLHFVLNEKVSNYTQLSKVSPREIKARYGIPADRECAVVDRLWGGRPLDLQVGDFAIFPQNTFVDSNDKITLVNKLADDDIFMASTPGYTRASDGNGWAINIRISRHEYEGLAQYRFLEEEQGE